MKKIEIYLILQILKSFFLVFFILIGISWLLQFTRLFSLITVHKIPIFNVFLLSTNIIPNVTLQVLPFIVFFTIFLTSLKLHNDRELIAAYTLGITIKHIIKPILNFSVIIFIFSLIISFFLSPHYYETFKKDEFSLRNDLDINKIGVNNFYNLNKETLINFEKDSKDFINILIFQTKPLKNIIIANKAEISVNDNKFELKLFDGFKTEIKDQSNETLTYDSYNFPITLNKKEVYDNSDSNTYNLFKLIKEQKYILINHRIIDSIILLIIIYSFMILILINLQFNLTNIILVSLISIGLIFFDNVLGNLSFKNNYFIIIMYLNAFVPILLILYRRLIVR